MTKSVVAIWAFGLGVCCTLVLRTADRFVWASERQELVTSDHHRRVYKDSEFSGDGPGSFAVSIQGVIPSFRTLDQTPIFETAKISDASQNLDGFDCRSCAFKDVTLKYAGGAYNLQNATFSGTTRLVLQGAAANTVAFLGLMRSISNGVPGAPSAAKKPVVRSAVAKKPLLKMDSSSPYIGP